MNLILSDCFSEKDVYETWHELAWYSRFIVIFFKKNWESRMCSGQIQSNTVAANHNIQINHWSFGSGSVTRHILLVKLPLDSCFVVLYSEDSSIVHRAVKTDWVCRVTCFAIKMGRVDEISTHWKSDRVEPVRAVG